MPRHTYHLQKETIKVMTGHCQDIATEAGYQDSYAYAITEARVTDPFAVFIHLYAACIRAGCDITPWITRMKLIEEKYRPLSKTFCLKKETAEFVKEANDVAVCHISDDDLEKQLAEVQQANAEGADLERALMFAINERDRKHLYQGKPVSYDTRERVKDLRRAG